MSFSPVNSRSTAKKILFILAFVALPVRAADWSLTTTAGKSITNWHGQAATQVVNFTWSPWTWRGFEIGVGVSPYFVYQPKSWFSDDYGDGNELIVGPRVHAAISRTWRRGAAVEPYLELAGGPLWTPKQVPDSTSQLNFVTDFGSGVVLGRGRTGVVVGYRFSHISNGGLSSRNPGWNVSSVALGLRVRR